MSSAKLALGCALTSLTLCACGATSKPRAGAGVAGTPAALSGTTRARGVVDDPRTKSLPCLRDLHVPLILSGLSDMRLGTPPEIAKVTFESTPGAAQAAQLSGQYEGAEVIGSALLYPGTMSDGMLKPIEKCLSQGVKG